MAYLIIDPCGKYPQQIMEFLARLDRGAVAVFTRPGRYLLWRDKWSKKLRHLVLDQYLATKSPNVRHLAAEIRHAWPNLDGVIPWDEEGVVLAAELSELLDLGWNSPEIIERCRDKGVMKSWLRQHGGVRVNASRVVTHAEDALSFQRQVGHWPIVVKPTAGSGSTDVYFAHGEGELLGACQTVMEGGLGDVLLEEFIGGRELCVNGIVDRRHDLLVTDVWSYERRPNQGRMVYYECTSVPTHDPVFSLLAQYSAQVVEALELRRAPIHMEVKVDDRGPCLIEVGARLSGGNLPVLASRLHGRSLIELVTCHWLSDLPLTGRDLDYARYDRLRAAVLSGIQEHTVRPIRKVHGVDEVRSLPSFAGFGILRPLGNTARLTVDLDTAAWEVYLVAGDEQQLVRDSQKVRHFLRYE
ncbi:MAG: ATP-grasp domain-containing protein [Thermoanaerobaculia bacterium]|nr:ATP-grasp domain-containing protein [Thermoanaerobaculia bacterium]